MFAEEKAEVARLGAAEAVVVEVGAARKEAEGAQHGIAVAHQPWRRLGERGPADEAGDHCEHNGSEEDVDGRGPALKPYQRLHHRPRQRIHLGGVGEREDSV